MSYKQYDSAAEDRERAFILFYKFFFPKNAPDSLRRRGTLREPILRSLYVDLHLNRVCNRVVLSDHLQKPAVSGSALIDDHYPVIGPFFRPDPGQTHCYQTVNLLFSELRGFVHGCALSGLRCAPPAHFGTPLRGLVDGAFAGPSR